MSGTGRIRVNWPAVHELLLAEGVAKLVEAETKKIDQRVAALGSQSRTDFAVSGERPRGAVIAGYEDGATAENTRRALLRSLGGHGA
ncbi:hypothetical protein [Streptomyces sp. NBC_01180]|uniref:hypothetical protein n=1 Tax=Streptomyces sp. NBC_01180 TaxID=2903763 RepID=UPI00386D6D07|nr:hypothetical protein OG708_09080 [Streptomyces sp. NBC_01180]